MYLETVTLPPDLALNLSHVQALRRTDAHYRARLLASLRPPLQVAPTTGPEHVSHSPRPRIAVFPFECLGTTSSYQWIGRRLAQKTAQLLHQSGHLDVVPERDLLRFAGSDASVAELRQTLAADYILEGSTLVTGDRFTLDVTLVDAASDRQLWTRSFADKVERVLELEKALLTQLAGSLEVESGPGDVVRGTDDSRAYLAYLESAFPAPDDVDQMLAAVESLRRAVRLDPGYGNAYTSLGASYFFLAEALQDDSYLPLAVESFQRALEVGGISPFNAAWCTWCVSHPPVSSRFDWSRSESCIREAMPRTDEYLRWLADPIEEDRAPLERGYARILQAAGLFAEAAAFADIEVERIRTYRADGWDRQGIAQASVPVHYANAGQLDKAQDFIEEDMARRPEVVENFIRRAELCHIPAGRLSEARADLAAYRASSDVVARQLGKRANAAVVERTMCAQCAVAEILLAIAEGDDAGARELISTTGHGELLGRLGDTEGMVAHLYQALEHGNSPALFLSIRQLLIDAPDPEGQAAHPGYRALLARTNLTDQWQRELGDRVNRLTPLTGVTATTPGTC